MNTKVDLTIVVADGAPFSGSYNNCELIAADIHANGVPVEFADVAQISNYWVEFINGTSAFKLNCTGIITFTTPDTTTELNVRVDEICSLSFT